MVFKEFIIAASNDYLGLLIRGLEFNVVKCSEETCKQRKIRAREGIDPSGSQM